MYYIFNVKICLFCMYLFVSNIHSTDYDALKFWNHLKSSFSLSAAFQKSLMYVFLFLTVQTVVQRSSSCFFSFLTFCLSSLRPSGEFSCCEDQQLKRTRLPAVVSLKLLMMFVHLLLFMTQSITLIKDIYMSKTEVFYIKESKVISQKHPAASFPHKSWLLYGCT